MSIGAVLDLLRPTSRTSPSPRSGSWRPRGWSRRSARASGYRRFTAYDCARLRFILTAQRDHYLPLKVIKAQLDAQPDGELPQTGSAYGAPRLVPVTSDDAADTTPRPDGRGRADAGPAEPRGPAGTLRRRRRAAHRAGQGRRHHPVFKAPGRFLRRAFGASSLNVPARWPTTASSRVTCGRSDLRPTGSPISSPRSRARWSRRARPERATGPTIWRVRSRRWRSRCTRR